jgi:glutamine synthetase adenylyltransferase
VTWNRDTLKEQALQVIDQQISDKEKELLSYDNAGTHADAVKEWRAKQEARISDIFRQLDTIDDQTLSLFKLAPMPRPDSYQRERLERELQSLRTKRAKIVAKADSLVVGEAGEIALTKTQLSEFFGL